MRKIVLLFIFFTCLMQLNAQTSNFRFGFQLAPSFSSIRTSDTQITKSGTNLGLKTGILAEYYISDKIAVTSGISIAFNHGGKLTHKIGGNFWSKSELTNPLLNTGDKPIADDTELIYKLQLVEVPFSLKYRTEERGYWRYFMEAPILNFGAISKSRGFITSLSEEDQDENIGKDVNKLIYSLGAGLGAEYSLSENISLVLGLYYNFYMSDLTDNGSYKASFVNDNGTPQDPNDDVYDLIRENSNGLMSSFSLRFGILF